MKLNIKSQSINSQVFFNMFGTILRTGIGIISMPLFTRMLGAEQYGVASLFFDYAGVLFVFMGLDCINCIAPGMYKYRDDYPRFCTSLLVYGSLVSLAFCILAAIFIEPISEFLKFNRQMTMLIFVFSFSMFVVEFACGIWTYEKKAHLNVFVSVSNSFATILVSYFLIEHFSLMQIPLSTGRILGYVIPELLFAIVLWICLFKRNPVGYVKEYWLYGTTFGSTLLFHHLANRVLTASDRIIMQQMNSPATEIGIYSFFIGYVAIMEKIQDAFVRSYDPFCYEYLGNGDYNSLHKHTKNYIQVYTIIICGFLMLSNEVMHIFSNSEYWSGLNVIPILAMANFFSFSSGFAITYEYFSNEPKYIAIGSIFAAILNVMLNIIMIPAWGMYGAAIATCVSYGARFMFHNIIVYHWKKQKSPFKMASVTISFLAVLVTSGIFYLFKDTWMIRWIIGVILGIYLIYSIRKRRSIF